MDMREQLRRVRRDLWLIIVVVLVSEGLFIGGAIAKYSGVALLGPRLRFVCVLGIVLGLVTLAVLLPVVRNLHVRLLHDEKVKTEMRQ